MTKPYGFEKSVALTLKTSAKERKYLSPFNRENNVYDLYNIQGRMFVVVLDDTIPAAEESGGSWSMSEATVSVYYRTPDTSEKSSQDPSNTITALSLDPWLDSNSDQISKRVFNPTTSDAPAGTPLLAVQDVNGDLYLINASGGTTSTPTGIRYIAGDNDDHLSVPGYGLLWHSDDGEEVSGGNRVMDAARPFDTFSTHWYVNRNDPVSIGALGYCDTLVEKHGPVRIDDSLVGTIQPFTVVGPKPNSYTIWPGRPGFLTIGPDYTLDGKPVVDCIQKPVMRVFGRLYQDLTQNADGTATAEFEIWFRDTDYKRKPAGWNTKLNVYGTLLNKNEKVKQGTFGWADYHSHYDRWEGDFACDPDNTGSSQSVSPGALVEGNLAFAEAPASSPSDVQTGVV